MHGRFPLALLALLLLLPASSASAAPRGQDIRRVEAVTTSAGALIRVTLRAPLDGRIALRFKQRTATKGNARRLTVTRRGRYVHFVFAGDARNLSRVLVRTRGDRASLRLPRNVDDCAALARLGRRLRPLRSGHPAIQRRLRAVARRRTGCEGATTPAAPDPPPIKGLTGPAARFGLAHGLTPEDPLEAGDDVAFTDASIGSELVGWAWDFGDGAHAMGPSAKHAFAPGRYDVLLTVANSRGQTGDFGRQLFVRGPGWTSGDADPVACPGPGETLPVTVRLLVPSWAETPNVTYAIPAGPCGADAGIARDLTITPGKHGDPRDAWGRPSSTLQFTFDLSDGSGTGTVSPSVTASWE